MYKGRQGEYPQEGLKHLKVFSDLWELRWLFIVTGLRQVGCVISNDATWFLISLWTTFSLV